MTKSIVTSMLLATMAVTANLALAEAFTPLGAEAGANADGSIPAWTGGFSRGVIWSDIGKQFVDPFADDPVKFSIDARNLETYRDNLTPGQIEQLRRNPDGYRLNVYETRRTARYPEYVYAVAQKNAGTARLAEGGNGVLDYQGYYPFIHPKSGVEVLWNHFMRYRGGSLLRTHTQDHPAERFLQ